MIRALPIAAAVSLALATPGAAQDPAAPAAPDPCATRHWTLDGASERPDEGHASYLPAWTPVLEAIAGCARSQPPDACLVVRGHADEVPFRDTMVHALGSQEAAQLARARGRAMMVMARLEELGIGAERLREGLPVLRSSVRGVEIQAVPGCLAAAPEGRSEAELAALVDRRVAEAFAAHQARPAEAAPEPAPAEPADLELAAPPHRFFGDAALDATLLGAEPTTVFAPTVQVGVGWRRGNLLARLGAGIAVGSEPEQRIGLEASLFAGWGLARWLELGPLLRYRLASVTASDPWLEQAFTAGVQANQCLWAVGAPGELCLTQAVLPLGLRQAQGTASNGQPVRGPWRSTYNAEVLVGLTLRRGL